jgi:hypothetical protein
VPAGPFPISAFSVSVFQYFSVSAFPPPGFQPFSFQPFSFSLALTSPQPEPPFVQKLRSDPDKGQGFGGGGNMTFSGTDPFRELVRAVDAEK